MNPLSVLDRLLGRENADSDSADAGRESDGGDIRPRALADALVAANSDRELDYTPASLEVLDDVLAAELADASDGVPVSTDASDASEHSPSDARAQPDSRETGREASATIASAATRDETVRQYGAYLGETFVRAYDGEWTFDEHAGWVVELPVTHRGEPLVLTIPSVLGDVVDGESSFAVVHDEFARELDVDAPTLADPESASTPTDPREQPAPDAVVAAFDDAADALAADHDALDYTTDSLSALDELARTARDDSTTERPYDPETDSLAFEIGGRTDAVAGYFAAVLRQHHDATYRGELAETLVVDGPTRSATLDPRALAAAVAAEETSFETVYDDLRTDLALTD